MSAPITTRHHSVVATTIMTLLSDGGQIPVEADLEYHSADPYAVRVVFSIAGSQSVEWVFARELLVTGLTAPAGMGDVQVHPVSDGVLVELNSPGGSARLLVRDQDLTRFVDNTLAAVPLGQEPRYFDLDREISLLARTGTAQF